MRHIECRFYSVSTKRVPGLDPYDGDCSRCRKVGKHNIQQRLFPKAEIVQYVLGFTIWGEQFIPMLDIATWRIFLPSQNCVCQRLALAVFLILFGSQLDS